MRIVRQHVALVAVQPPQPPHPPQPPSPKKGGKGAHDIEGRDGRTVLNEDGPASLVEELGQPGHVTAGPAAIGLES